MMTSIMRQTSGRRGPRLAHGRLANGRHGDLAAPLPVDSVRGEAGASLELHRQAFADVIEADAFLTERLSAAQWY